MSTSKRKTRAHLSALVRAEYGGGSVRLDVAQRDVFREALRLGAVLADEVEAKVSSYGRWLLEAVFNNDAAAALDEKSKNPVRIKLVRRSGAVSVKAVVAFS